MSRGLFDTLHVDAVKAWTEPAIEDWIPDQGTGAVADHIFN